MIKQQFKVSLMLPVIYHLAYFINVRFPPGITCFQKIITVWKSESGKWKKKEHKSQRQIYINQSLACPISQSIFYDIRYVWNVDFSIFPWPCNHFTANGLKHRLTLSGYSSFADATAFPKLLPVITFLFGLPWYSPLA